MEEGGHDNSPSDESTETLPRNDSDTVQTANDAQTEHTETPSATRDSPVSNSKQGESEKKDAQNPEEKLNDWLLHTSRGIGNIKFTKRRWFKFIDETCKLYMYRDPQDLVPLTEINIATSSLYFDPGNRDKPGSFLIKSDSKEMILDAGNRRRMTYWIQTLQAKRRDYSFSRGAVDLPNKRVSNLGGLLSNNSRSMDELNDLVSISGSIDIPEIQVSDSDLSDQGSVSSTNSIPSAKISLRGLNNFKSELQQKWQNVKFPVKMVSMMKRGISVDSLGKPSRESDSVFYCDLKPRSDSGHISISSLNSNDSQGQEVLCLLSDNQSDPRKTRTGSQISQSSNDSQDLERTLCSTTKQNSSRNVESWTLLDKSDPIFEEAESVSDINRNKDCDTLTNKSVPMPIKNSRTVTTAGKSMISSGFSSLKKIRLGRRQISEPTGTPPSGAGVSKDVSMSQGQGQGHTSSVKDMNDLEEELQANREIISLLQQQVSSMSLELVSRKGGDSSTEEETALQLLEKDKLVCTLEHQVAKLQQEQTETLDKLRSTEENLHYVQDQLEMYTDMLKAKDEVIVSLNEMIPTDGNHDSVPRSNSFDQPDVVAQSISNRDSSSSANSTNMERVNLRELEKYKDICQGYEIQHKLLVKEILEMNELRKDDITKEKQLAIDLEQMRAKYCQIKSKYYVLLQQFKAQGPVRGTGEDQDIVNQLLNDALEPEEDGKELHLTGSIEEYDRYGFSRKHYNEDQPEEDEDELVSKAAMLDRQSEEISTHVKEADHTASLLVKWENYLARDGKFVKGQELKTLIRQGIPHRYRAEVWKGLVNLQIARIREKNGPEFYQKLLQQKASAGQRSDPSIKQIKEFRFKSQIELDLLRTLPNNRHYETIESEGVVKLRRVLLAFSEYNREIGYCQGLNRLAAIALLFLEEEDAFWCLVAIVDYLLPAEYFSSTLMAAQADQRVLKDLVQLKLPAVHQMLEKYNVEISLFTFNWFLTVFVDNVPTEMFLRIWDTFLYEGSKVLFRFAIAFLKKAETEILKQKDGLQLNKYMRTIGEKMTNVRQISWYAFHWINPFRMKLLASKRQQHLHDIKGELAELDKLRHGMRMERASKQQDEIISDDESEN